ncbi:iron-containing redox enzyme family protein [Pseudomonas koreensis]|uniref:iron-containing redox enzyme family protein n=1 Tax=Pseudomonas koreensis TaxID=198620 RepID=UPI0021C8C692|nr:iron-containing redox enzyme family protein [Pseudomonas koreensis]MCU0091905.1 iron-containing redox enzyme family protein [Pseudomonas koreensis]
MTVLTRLQAASAPSRPLDSLTELRCIHEALLADEHPQQLARAFLEDQLLQAAQLKDELPSDPAHWHAWVAEHCADVARQYADYLQQRKAGGARQFFSCRAHALYFLQAVAPTKLVDGAWLYGLLAQWRDPRFSSLISTYLEELGEGNPAQNHVVIYRQLLAEHGLEPGSPLPDERYLQGALQLALGAGGMDFLPEVIGYNLGYEQLPLHLLISSYELSELGIDPYYFTLHVTIDNASTGHAQKAVQAVLDLLPLEADRSDFLRRVSLGYRLNDLGQGSRAIIEGFDLERELLAMLERKCPFAQHMHSDYCRFEGKTVNQWLADPQQLPGFLQALQDKGWIKRNEDPQGSRFWQLIDGDGAAMFGVFSAYEKQLVHDWIAGDWISAEKTVAFRRRPSVPAPIEVPEQDPDVQRLNAALQGQDAHTQIATLIPWLAPARHAHPAGLLATRRFIQLKSGLR